MKESCENVNRHDASSDDKFGYYFNNVGYHKLVKVTTARIDGRVTAPKGYRKHGEIGMEYFERENSIAYVCKKDWYR